MRRTPLTLPATGEGAAALLPAGLEMSPARKIGAEFLPPRRQGNCMRGSPTPSPLRGATSPPSGGRGNDPGLTSSYLSSPPSFGGEVVGKADRSGGRARYAIAPPEGRERCRVPARWLRDATEIGACGMPSPCGVGQSGGTRAQGLPAVHFPAVAPDGMPSFAKLRVGEKDRQEISPPYLHLVACAPHRPRGAGDRGTARHSRPMNWRRGCGNITPAALEDQGHDRSWEAALPCSGTRG